jgi:TonB-linked SusC/RagA family outer membrane protein
MYSFAEATPASVQQSGKRVTGVVTDVSGEPVTGANVMEKGTTNGAMTGVDGDFSLTVAENAVLRISYIGYVTQEVRVTGNKPVLVTLQEDAKALDEVVVVGYGTQKKVSLTGSVATVKPDDIKNISSSNLTNALAGRLTGVTIKQNEGGRPGNASDIVIRARGTWNSTAPLYVIDGVAKSATEFNLLSTGEIESLSVLKDASTSAIYGSRAANGVILVTTKKGQKGRPSITYSGSVNVATDFAVLPQRETAAQRMAWINDRVREVDVNPNSYNIPYNFSDGFRYWPTIYREDGSLIGVNVFTPDEEEYYRTHDYDMLKDAWNTPVTNTHAVSVSGGTDNIRYFVAGNYYDEGGVFKSLSYRKYSVRGNLEADIVHGLKAGLSINLSNSENKGPHNGQASLEGLFYQVISSSRLIPAKLDGKYVAPNNTLSGTNVLARLEGANGIEQKLYRNSDYTATLEWNVPWVKGLNLKASYNQLLTNTFDKSWRTPYMAYELKVEGTNNHIVTREFSGNSILLGSEPQLSESHKHTSAYQLNGIISYSNTFAKKHEVSAMLGFEQSENFSESFKASMTNFELVKPYFMFGPSDKNYYGIEGSGEEDARLSYIGELNYAFDNRYLFKFLFRRDASVKFAPKYRWGFFPSASAAWRISEEKFFKDNISFINQLKLRSSYGLTGNDAVGAWQWLDGAGRGGGMYYGGTATGGGVSIGAISNPYITWEKSRNFDAGLDLGILNNMFAFSGNYFFRHTYDILGSQTGNLPDTFGGSLANSNYGAVNSFGIEVELEFNKALTKDLSVWARGNFGWADNRLVEWAETGVPPHLSRIGKNWDRTYGFVSDGIIWEMTPNGDGTYNISTSTGSKYTVNHDYAAGRGSNYDIEAQNNHAMRPGFIFIKDIGSQQFDSEGNTIYSSTPDGTLTDGFADKQWIVDHINPPYNYGLLLGGKWKGISLEVFLQGTAGNMAGINHPFAISGDWYGSSFGHWSADHYSFANNPRGTMPLPSNFSGYYTMGTDSGNSHSFWMRDASFVRLKMVSLAYEFDKRLISKIGLNNAGIHITGNNLAMLYNPLGDYDPEVAISTNSLSGYEGGYATGIGVYPLLRSFTVGLDVSF